MANLENKFLDATGLTYLIQKIKTVLNSKQDALTFDSTPTANSTNPVTSGGIKTAIDNATELHVVPTQGTGLLFYAAAGYIINQSQINTTCEGILTALKNGKKLYFELDNREDGGAKETYSAVYADYVEPENESTVINIIANHSLLAFYKVTLTKAYGATNWVVTYVDKTAQDKIVNINETGSGNAVTNWTVNDDTVTLTKGLTFQEQLVSGTSIKTINNTSLLGSGDISVQAPLTFDSTPTANSINPVTSGGIKTELDKKKNKPQELFGYFHLLGALEEASEENPVQLTGQALTQFNDLASKVQNHEEITILDIPAVADSELYENTGEIRLGTVLYGNSNMSYYLYIHKDGNNYWATFDQPEWQKKLTFDDSPTSGSTNPVRSGGVATALTSYVTLSTSQNITGEKTFVGAKKIKFKKSTANDKLGFTLYDNNNKELCYLEYNTGDLCLGSYYQIPSLQVKSRAGFKMSDVSSGINAVYRILTPYAADAKTPFSLTNAIKDFYFPLGVSNGTTTLLTNSTGLLDISSFFNNYYTKTDTNTLLSGKQGTLVSGTSIKTINNVSVLGSGNIDADDVVHGALRGSDFVKGDWTNEGGTWTYSIPLSGGVITPNENKIYVDVSTNKIYRWKGSYVQIGGGDVTEMTNAEVDTMMTN